MVTKEQLIRAIYKFIDNDMIPRAEGNYKIILNVAKAALNHKADGIFEAIKNNSLVAMFGVIDENDNVDVDLLANVLSDGLGSDEYMLTFKFLTSTYSLGISASDIQTIKRYAM